MKVNEIRRHIANKSNWDRFDSYNGMEAKVVSSFNEVAAFLRERECSTDIILMFYTIWKIVAGLNIADLTIRVCHETRYIPNFKKQVECAVSGDDPDDYMDPCNKFLLHLGMFGGVFLEIKQDYITIELNRVRYYFSKRKGLTVATMTPPNYHWDACKHNEYDLEKIIKAVCTYIDANAMLDRLLKRVPSLENA